jgi:zinc protease
MMNEGAGPYDSQAFQKALEEHSIDFSFENSRDSFEGSLRTLTQYRELAFELLRLSLTQLRFDGDAVERVRAQIIANLAREAEDPDDVAGKAWWRMVFPATPTGVRFQAPRKRLPRLLSMICAARWRSGLCASTSFSDLSAT